MSDDVFSGSSESEGSDVAGGDTQGDSRLPLIVVLTLVGAGVAAVGSILPWASVLVFSVAGTDSWYGRVTLVVAVTALVLLFTATRKPHRQKQFTYLAAGCLAVCAALYIFIGYQMSAAFTDGDAKEFSGWISRGFGLEIGVVASVIAVGCAAILVMHVRRGGSLTDRLALWGDRETIVFSVSLAATSLLTFYDVFFVPLIGGVVAGVVWCLVKRSQPLSGVASRISVVLIALALVGGVVEGVVFGLDDEAEPADFWNFGTDDTLDLSDSSTSDSQGDGSDVTGDTVGGESLFGDDSRPCVEVFADVKTVDQAYAVFGCEKGGETVFPTMETVSCKNSSMLMYNDYGWGKSGAAWNQAKKATPSLGDCQGLAGDTCSDAFAVGVETQKGWDFADLHCLDDSGKIVQVSGGFSMICFESDKQWIANDFGWGYIGEAWQEGDGPPNGC